MAMWLMILWGCAPGSVWLPTPLHLSASALRPGTPLQLQIEGLRPGSQVQLAATWASGGPGPCPGVLRGACWQRADAEPIGTAIADGSGTAHLIHTVDEPGGEVLALQAAELGPSAYPLQVRLSEVIERRWGPSCPSLDGDQIVAGPEDLARLDGICGIGGDLIVVDTALEELRLPELIEVRGDVRIWENPALTELRLPALERIGGDLNLFDNPGMGRLHLAQLAQIDRALRIHRMPGLVDLRGLGGLRSVGELYLYHDTALTSLDGLDRLTTIDGGVELLELPALQRAVLPALETIGGRLYVLIAPSLVQLEAPALTELRSLELHEVDALPDLGSFPRIERLEGELRLEYNNWMASLSGLPALQQIHSVSIRFNPSLASLDALDRWHTLEDELVLHSNNSLSVLRLPALQQARRLEITRNGALSALELPALEQLAELSLSDNPSLSHCAVEAWLDQLDPDQVACHDNLDDGCTRWCDPTETSR